MKTKLLSIICWAMLTCYATNINAQANTKLSNLISPTAVNVSLLPGGTTGTKNLGSNTKRWENGYFNGTVYCYGAGSSYGIYGTGSSYGVYGRGSYGVYGVGSSYGVRGSGPTGVYGYGSTYGVYGVGNSFGVYGQGSTYGVRGAGGNYGVYCNGTYGVYAVGSSYGVYGTGNAWAGYFNGKVYSSGGYTTSDQKLKQNIRDFTSAMDIINKLKPKQYEFRQDASYKLMNLPQGSHFGLIAQDVEKVLPDLVTDTKFETAVVQLQATETALPQTQESNTETQSETIEFKSLNYTELIPVLIKGMQELNDALKSEIQNLKSEIDKLKSAKFPGNALNMDLSSASLVQNVPNPFTNATTIKYTLLAKYNSAQIIITDENGRQLKQLDISGSGKGSINIDAATFSAGTYQYSLIIDGKLIDTRQMMVAK